MTSEALPLSRSRSGAGVARRRRFGALVRLLDARARTRFGAQMAKLFAGLALVGYGIVLSFAGRGHAAVSVVQSAVGALSWIAGGVVALSAAGPRTAEDEAVHALARQRGWGARALGWAELWAVARRVGGVVGVPAILLSLEALALAVRGGAIASRAILLVGVVVYVAVLATSVAVLVRLAKSLSPERGRWVVVFLVLLPEALRSVFPMLPSLPELLGLLLDQIVKVGGRG